MMCGYGVGWPFVPRHLSRRAYSCRIVDRRYWRTIYSDILCANWQCPITVGWSLWSGIHIVLVRHMAYGSTIDYNRISAVNADCVRDCTSRPIHTKDAVVCRQVYAVTIIGHYPSLCNLMSALASGCLRNKLSSNWTSVNVINETVNWLKRRGNPWK